MTCVTYLVLSRWAVVTSRIRLAPASTVCVQERLDFLVPFAEVTEAYGLAIVAVPTVVVSSPRVPRSV